MIVNIIKILFHKLFGKKTDFLLEYKFEKIEKYYGRACLDVGAGTGRFAQFLASREKEILALDIVNKMESGVPFQLFNGYEIPLKSKSFNTVVLFFILHHTDHQVQILKECMRVAKNTIIIGEDVMENVFDRIMGKIHLGTSPWSKSKNGFKSDSQWTDLFSAMSLKLIDKITIPRNVYAVYPVARIIYVLQCE